ncbi:hypothetical protein J6590_005232 [Homalodisca vitripennis]|nr:hypothetical protein J6590_005232 [Homalodisca vitripennis]
MVIITRPGNVAHTITTYDLCLLSPNHIPGPCIVYEALLPSSYAPPPQEIFPPKHPRLTPPPPRLTVLLLSRDAVEAAKLHLRGALLGCLTLCSYHTLCAFTFHLGLERFGNAVSSLYRPACQKHPKRKCLDDLSLCSAKHDNNSTAGLPTRGNSPHAYVSITSKGCKELILNFLVDDINWISPGERDSRFQEPSLKQRQILDDALRGAQLNIPEMF